MRSKISFFDRTVIRKDLTRFMPMWLVYCAIILTETLGQIGSEFYYRTFLLGELSYDLGPMAIANVVFALAAAVLLFSDLFSSRMCNSLHALPLRRETWFGSHFLAGLLFFLIPYTVKILVILPFLGNAWFVALAYLGGVTLQYLFFFSLAALCAMCTGGRFATALMYAVLNFAAMLVYWFISTFCEPILIGIQVPTRIFELLCPVVYLSDSSNLILVHETFVRDDLLYSFDRFGSDWIYLMVMGLLSLGLLALTVVAYRKRRLESAGEFLVFKPLIPIFEVLLTLTVGAVFQSMGLLMGLDIVSTVIGLVLGGALSGLLLTKNVKGLAKGLAKGGAVAGVLGAILLVLWLDPMGITTWLPEAEQVESVVISQDFDYDSDDEWYADGHGTLTLTDPDDIQRTIDTHAVLIEEGQADYGDWYNTEYSAIHITYTLSGGREVVRRYYYTTDSRAAQATEQFWASAEYVLGYEDWESWLGGVNRVSVTTDYRAFDLTGDAARELLTVIKTDCDNGTWDLDYAWETEEYYIWIWVDDETSILVTPNCKETIAWLQTNHPDQF